LVVRTQASMRNALLLAFLVCFGVTGCADWEEGQSTLSTNKKWLVNLQTKSGTNGFTRIRVYDTDVYPSLKTKADPNPSGKPRALFIVPVEFYARSVNMKWDSAGTVLRMEQPGANLKPPIYYSLDLNTFSFSKIEK
jgi:hypothetical protein